jgi:hypothetical protein
LGILFYFILVLKVLACSKGMGFFGGEEGVQHSIFLKLAPPLGSVKSSLSHGDWRFYFFPRFFLK